MAALRDWIALSHKINPPDGSGEYKPMTDFLFISNYEGNQLAQFWGTLEQDQDPFIRMCAQAGRVVSVPGIPGGFVSDEAFAAERQFRLHAQDALAHSEAAKPGPLHNQVWNLITDILFYRLLNHPACAQEYLEASRFAIAQKDIQPNLFYRATEALERKRQLREEFEVVDGALALILEKPESYPELKGSYANRGEVVKNLQQKRQQLAAELAGTNGNVTASPWKTPVCLLDMAEPINGLGWLYKPVIQDGQVCVVALGFHEWGLPEDSLQLMRISLKGGPPALLGRARIDGIDWQNRPYVLKRGPASRLKDETPAPLPVVRAACIGVGCYFAATCSGIYIFQIKGGRVQHLDTANGLPSDDVQAVAFLDGKLYLAAGELDRAGYLAAYDPATRKVATLASSRRSEHISPLDDQPPFYTLSLVADTIRHRLIMAFSSVLIPNGKKYGIAPTMGIWSYLPATNEFKRLTPLRIATLPPVFLKHQTWAGLADPNRLVVKSLYCLALFDLRDDRPLSVFDFDEHKTHSLPALKPSTVAGDPNQVRFADGPFFLRDDWFYSARPFERAAMSDGRREQLTPLRTDYPFEPSECLQLLADGKHVLAADPFSLWLLELKPEEQGPSAGKGEDYSALTLK